MLDCYLVSCKMVLPKVYEAQFFNDRSIQAGTFFVEHDSEVLTSPRPRPWRFNDSANVDPSEKADLAPSFTPANLHSDRKKVPHLQTRMQTQTLVQVLIQMLPGLLHYRAFVCTFCTLALI
ncbi:hypothetical protein PMIN06_010340 [Paraphaeosphaeria minitans]